MKFPIILCLLAVSTFAWSASPEKSIQLLKDPSGKKVELQKEDLISIERLEGMFMMNAKTPGLAAMLKSNSLKHKQKAVPTLIKVMKESKYPDQNRWQATMLLAQIMGKKSAPFIAKFSTHPNWMMRLASLKALLGLSQAEYLGVYSKALKDPSLIVRVQALDNISQLKIKSLGPEVWNMMYDQSNYSGPAGNRKRTSIVRSVIRTLGDLRYEKAGRPMAKLIQKPMYQDLIEDLDYSLEKITGEKSPNEVIQRRKFWSKMANKNSSKI
ncbi:MAG TPA: HEAT repeat domain-containing protein [Bacteriovoracaceae bacterium]|nr:HEAT repeat domain-containing protein [Bacteriovoracaceae bacterium]